MTYDTVSNQVADDLLFARYRDFFLKTCFTFWILKKIMCVSVSPACMSVHRLHAWCPWRPDIFRFCGVGVLELQMVVSCLLGAGNQTQALWKNSQVWLFFFFFLTLFSVNGYFTCMCICAPHACSVHKGHQKALESPGTRITCLWVIMWVLGTGPLSSERATCEPSL